MTTTSYMESDGMVGRHEKEYGSEFDNYEEAEDEYEEEESYSEPEESDGFDFESRPPPGLESFEDDESNEEEESNESESEFEDGYEDPFSGDDDDLDF